MINYQNIQDSILFYQDNGYTRIESPWTVTQQISNITKPLDKEDFLISNKKKVLVASGEQSFLYLYLKEFLPKGRFQTVTPCFRDEVFDEHHTKYFIKNELIITDNVNEIELEKMIKSAQEFFKSKLSYKVDIIRIDNTYDLSYKGVELGSYGIRECSFLKWIYGTGCAEPRLSYCQNLK